MTALAADRNTPSRQAGLQAAPVAADEVIFAGALVILEADGFAAAGRTATGMVALGVARYGADNTGGADGAINVEVQEGIYRFGNSASSDEITRAEIGDTCYIVDDQTVAKTDGSSSRSAAGKVIDIDSVGVWVKVGVAI